MTTDFRPDTDVVALLLRQHGNIRNLFDTAESAAGNERRRAFRALVYLLAVHETAEEEIIHPYLRQTVEGGDALVAERLQEEKEVEEATARLDRMDADDEDFLPLLRKLRADVTAHARAEERYEFAHLRRSSDSDTLAAMAKGIRAAEATTPSYPHPGVVTAAQSLLVGPVAAIADRARDAARGAMDNR